MHQIDSIKRRKTICHLIAQMRSLGSWAGETHIQKCVLFLQCMLDVPLGYRFGIYLHGPYSFDLRDELSIMRARYQLEAIPQAGYGPSLILGERGQLAIEDPSPHAKQIQFVACHISTNDVRELERISTAFYIKRTRPDLSEEEIASEISRIKPHIRKDQARISISDVNDLQRDADSM